MANLSTLWLHQEVVGWSERIPSTNKKNKKITAKTILSNVNVYAQNYMFNENGSSSYIGSADLDGEKNNKILSFSKNDYGMFIVITAILKPEVESGNSNPAMVLFGKNTGKDYPFMDNDGARLEISFLDSATVSSPAGVGVGLTSLHVPDFPDDYLLKVKDSNLFGSGSTQKRYIRVKVNDSNGAHILEQSVYLHYINQNGGSLGVAYQDENNKLYNGDLTFNLNSGDSNKDLAYIIAFIKVIKEDGEYVFKIGDPRTDATVTITEE